MIETQSQPLMAKSALNTLSDSKMSLRILIPILGFAPQGGYRVLSELANAWTRHGHDCTFLVPATSPDPYFPTKARILRCDRKGRFSESISTLKRQGYDNVLSIFAGLRHIGRDYDVIFANHCLTAWPVALANCRNAKKFYYIQAYEPDYYPAHKSPIKHLLAKGSYLLGLRQITNAVTYKGWGIRPEAVIPPGIDLSIFEKKQSDNNFHSKEIITLGTIGRTEPYKGTATALAAYRLLRKRDPRLRMKVGFGNVEPNEDIEVVPIRGDMQLAAFYRSIDILVVSCQGQYGAPHYPLIESMASGTPVVHTGYYPGDLTNSWQASDSTPEAVAEALEQLIQTPESEMRKRVLIAREIVEYRLAWDAVASHFEQLFLD